jgi:hypothetical protein
MRLRTLLTKQPWINGILGAGLIASSLCIRFVFHVDSVLPMVLFAAGLGVVLRALKQALTSKSANRLYRRAAA